MIDTKPPETLELNLSDYWAVVRKRRLPVVLVALCVLGLVAAYAELTTPVYRGQAILKFEPPMNKISGNELFALVPILQTQVSLLNSLDMAGRIAKKMHWDLEEAQRHYKADKISQSALISIYAKSVDRAQAASLANLIADLAIEWDLETRSAQVRKTLNEVSSRRKSVEETLRRLEEQRKIFLATHETTGLSAALANTLLELEERRKELLRKFTKNHPDVRKLDARIAVARKRLNTVPAEQDELTRLSREIRVQEETYLTLSKEMEEAKILVDSTVSYLSVVSRATPPERVYWPKKLLLYALGLLAGAFLGIFVAFALENLDISITTLEEIEKVLEAPVLGIIPHFGSESRWQDLMASYFRRERHSEESFRSFLIFRQAPKSPNIEVYHSLRINVQSQLARPQKMVLTFTSTGVAEGKTMTATNFALAAAHSGMKTLLVGADVRRPNLHRIFGLSKEPGFIEALTGRVPWQEAVRNTVDILMGEKDLERLSKFPGIDNFKVMTGWSSSTAELVNLFQSHRLPKLINELREAFDLVVFDCPPVLLFVDALLIGQHTDGVILVYRSGKMARRALKRARDQIVVSKGKILGVVLNGAKAADMGPGYGYYADYGHYAKPPGEGGG